MNIIIIYKKNNFMNIFIIYKKISFIYNIPLKSSLNDVPISISTSFAVILLSLHAASCY